MYPRNAGSGSITTTHTRRQQKGEAGAEEGAAQAHGGVLKPYTGPVDLVIQPGYQFKVTQALLTNFHLPKSSLLLLVSALIGRETLLKLYAEAIERSYRFFSYGDAMWIDAAAVQPQARPPAR